MVNLPPLSLTLSGANIFAFFPEKKVKCRQRNDRTPGEDDHEKNLKSKIS